MHRIPTLDGWRAVAILGVVWSHLHLTLPVMMYVFADWDSYYASAARLGQFGVDLFFGLSGLLITGLLLKEWNSTGDVSLKGFYIRRGFRILPVYLLFVAVTAVMGSFHSPREVMSCLLFFRNYLPDSRTWNETEHLWSLSVEEHFYLIWPGLLVLCGLKWGRSVAALGALTIGLWRLLESQLDLNLFPSVLPLFRTDLRLDALLWGAVTAFTLNDPTAREKLRRELRFGTWLGIVAVMLVSMVFYSKLTSMFVAVLIPMVLAGTVLHPEWRISRLLDMAPMAWIGRISYSLYIWQQLFLLPGWRNSTHFLTQLPWNLCGILAVACASYYLVETPLLRLGRSMAGGLNQRVTKSALEFNVGHRTREVQAP